MNFAPSLTAWQWLIPAGAAAVVVALYCLKTRRRPMSVPSTLLWRRTIEDRRVNAFWQRLRGSLLLLLQLAAIAAAALALLRPTWQGSVLRGGRYVFLIDRSASMSTTDVRPSRLEEAKRRAAALVDQMRDGDVAMIVSFAAGANVDQAFTDNRARLRRAIEAIRPSHESTSLDEALRICSSPAVRGRRAAEIANEASSTAAATSADATPAQVFIFSDGNLAPTADAASTSFAAEIPATFIPVGTTDVENLGITGFAVRRNEATGAAQALAKVRNFSATARTVDLELRIGGRVVDRQRLSLAAAARRDVVFAVPDAPDGAWEARLESDAVASADALADDDRAWAVLAPPRKARVLVVTAGNRYLESALSTDEARQWCEATLRTPDFLTMPEYRQAAEEAGFDAVFFDRCRPGESPATSTLYLGSLPPEEGWKALPPVEAPPIIDTARTHPLMQNTSAGEVLVAEATPLVGPSGTRTLLDSPQGALAAIAPRRAFEDAVLGFAVTSADGTLQTNWPLVDGAGFEQFVLNAVQYFGRVSNGAAVGSLRPGEPLRLRLDGAAPTIELMLPDGSTTALARSAAGDYSFYETRLPGIYQIARLPRAAVNLFDETESNVNLPGEPKLRLGREEIIGQSRWETAAWQGWRWPTLAVLVLLGGEWYIYGRQTGSRGRRAPASAR